MYEIPILYHEEGILVVNKPYGLPTQPTRDNQKNLYNTLQDQYPYVGLHHRLDTPVSGLLLLCTEKKWNKAISQSFQKQRIKRQYWAACFGTPPPKGSWIEDIQGKEAKTNFEILQHCRGYSILNITLETGRTHQIRKHAANAHHPILGDRRYGGSASKLCTRLALHAHRISFLHPATKKNCTIQAPLPKELLRLIPK